MPSTRQAEMAASLTVLRLATLFVAGCSQTDRAVRPSPPRVGSPGGLRKADDMNRYGSPVRVSAAGALLALAGLAVAGCSAASTSSPEPAAGGTGAPSSAAPAGSGSFAGTALFPIAVGNTWTYKVATAGLGAGTSVDKIIKVVPVPGGNQVTTTHTFNGVTNTETLLFGSDGSITQPLTSIGSATVRVKSGSIRWPSQAVIDSGQPVMSTIVIVASVGGQSQSITAHVTVRGAGPATVTVPAGTYHATIVESTASESIAGITVSIEIRTWLAPGVGPVKSQVTTNGAVVSGEELMSFVKG